MPRPITHAVKFYEKGDRPLEIVTSRQSGSSRPSPSARNCWRRGRQLACIRDTCARGYENWVNGLNGDWCISRQRFFGVPFPVWYPLREDGSIDYTQAIPGRRGQPSRGSVNGRAAQCTRPRSGRPRRLRR
ncbi:MAG: class I tRNA ligase family protein [Vicinamibacterales bacterium]